MEKYITTLSLPRNVIAGEGSICHIEEIIIQQKPRSVCFVVDEAVYKNNGINIIEEAVEAKDIRVVSITSVKGEPTFNFIKGLLQNKELLEADLFVAIGGGSVIDTAKILSACRTNPALIKDLHNSAMIKNNAAYLIAVPTTSGTGAEATPNAILLDEERQLKVGVVSQLMIAQTVILDPDLTKSMPRHIAASTGVDALAHALESFLSKKANHLSDLYGLNAMDLIFKNLERACCIDDSEARKNMLLASFYAGMCLAASSTCAVHAMAYPLSGIYHVPHGVSISMLLFPVMEKIKSACVDRLSIVYQRCFGKSLGSPERDTDEFVNQLHSLLQRVNALYPMSAYGVTQDNLKDMADSAITIKRLFDNNPMALSTKDLIEIYEKAL